ncbi:ATP-binding protein [Candidatus Poribacteria bacterium]
MVRCEPSIPDDLWPAEIDEGQINQVINNLLINADQAMPEGGTIKLEAENVILGPEDGLPLRDGAYIKISVEDQGIGMSRTILQKIFDPFFTTKQAGSGLGLAASYSIVQKYDGYITVESELDVGTIFHIYLPAFPEQMSIKAGKEENGPIMGEGKILVMDDEKHVRNSVVEMLISIGYEATTTIDADEAIEKYREAVRSEEPFDAIIMDLTIPGGIGGADAIQRLVEVGPAVKAIVSSGYSNDPVLANFREYGFKGVIVKPYDVTGLSKVLHGVMMGINGT